MADFGVGDNPFNGECCNSKRTALIRFLLAVSASASTSNNLLSYFSSKPGAKKAGTKTGTGASTKFLNDAVRLTGLKVDTARKYLEEYERAKGSQSQKDGLNEFVGAKGKGKTSAPAGFLRMTGVLEALRSREEMGNNDGSSL